jgi:hypothetical protein
MLQCWFDKITLLFQRCCTPVSADHIPVNSRSNGRTRKSGQGQRSVIASRVALPIAPLEFQAFQSLGILI